MQLPEDFWAFSFELTNFHLFQQNLMPTFYAAMTSLWRKFSVNVVAYNKVFFFNFCSESSLNSATDCCQTERQIQPDALSSTRIAQSLNNASTRTVHKCLKRNNGHLITLQIWMEWRYSVWGAMHEAILKNSTKPKTVWIKTHPGEDMGQFSARPFNNAVPSFTNSLTGVHEWWWKTFWTFFSTQKCVRTYSVSTVLSSWDNFW